MDEYRCKICDSQKYELTFFKQVLYKYKVKYYKCEHCGFIQTEKPYWLNESYSSAIAKLDIGLIYRTLNLYPIIMYMIKFLFSKEEKKYIDYGGGYGIFTRLMRDRGFDFYNYDPYCQNIFSADFNVKLSEGDRYELLTSFEVFEHLEYPVDDVKKMLQYSESLVFTTELQPASEIESWWYLSPETGQHICIFSYKSLSILSDKLDCNFYTNGNIHLFTRKKVSKNLFKMITYPHLAKWISALSVFRKETFLQKDYEKIKNELSQLAVQE
jgi:hypothetical protein